MGGISRKRIELEKRSSQISKEFNRDSLIFFVLRLHIELHISREFCQVFLSMKGMPMVGQISHAEVSEEH